MKSLAAYSKIAAPLKNIAHCILTKEQKRIECVELLQLLIQLSPVVWRRECYSGQHENFSAHSLELTNQLAGLLRRARYHDALPC
jgi:hypothetical protein